MALHGKACCVFSVVLHLPNCKSDVTVFPNSPVISLMVVPAFGGLWQAADVRSVVSLACCASLPRPSSFSNQG